jgi:hypothetical protein
MDALGRLYAEAGSYYFRFTPVAGTLSIKVSALDISATTGIVGETQLADLAVTNAKIANMSVAKLTSGTIDAQTITLATTTGSAIQQGKDGPSDTDPGFWLGYAAGASMFSIGDATNYMKWTGTQLLVVGEISGKIAANLDMQGYALYNCTDLRGGTAATTNTLNLDTNEWIGADANTYLLLAATGSLRWLTAGTVYGGTLYLESGNDLVLTTGSAKSLQIKGATIATGKTAENEYLPIKKSDGTQRYIRLYS